MPSKRSRATAAVGPGFLPPRLPPPMNADQVIELRKLWARFNYGPILPAATVLAEHDWLAYVAAMTAAVPSEDSLTFPEERDVAWAWPDGVVIVLSDPVEVDHTITSVTGDEGVVPVEAHHEMQLARGVVIGAPVLLPTRIEDGAIPAGDGLMGEAETYKPLPPEMLARPTLWIGDKPEDIISGHWLPGSIMLASKTGQMSHASRLLLSLITALGHRLTRLETLGASRQERRRAERELPGLRVLQLATGATVSRPETTGIVEWSHRWLVRGHWRLQPHGPQRSLRKTIWIDPYVKGPEDKPLDVRPTIWKTGSP